MKKLTKLNINPEKVMKNEELIILRGGYGGHCCFCQDRVTGEVYGAMAAVTWIECNNYCSEIPTWFGVWDIFDPACSEW